MKVTRHAPTQHQKAHVWNSASTIRGKDPNLYRRDCQGHVIYKPSYGKTQKWDGTLTIKNHLRKVVRMQQKISKFFKPKLI